MKTLTLLWNLTIILLILQSSCSHTTVNRINRHERVVVVKSIITRDRIELYRHLKLKADHVLNCDRLIIKELVSGSHVKGICVNRP